MKVQLGMRYKDVVTGFVGTATSLTKYITGCDRVTLTPAIDMKETVMRESLIFDVTTVELVDKGCYDFVNKKEAKESEITKKVIKGGPEVYSARSGY